MAQPYLMGTAKVIKSARLFDKDQAKLSLMIAHDSLIKPPLVSISMCYILRALLIFVQFGYIGLMKFFYELFVASSRSIASKLPQEHPEHATLPVFREISLTT